MSNSRIFAIGFMTGISIFGFATINIATPTESLALAVFLSRSLMLAGTFGTAAVAMFGK